MSTIGTSLNEFIEELVYVKKHLLSMHCIQRIVLSSPGDAVITDLQSFCSGFSSWGQIHRERANRNTRQNELGAIVDAHCVFLPAIHSLPPNFLIFLRGQPSSLSVLSGAVFLPGGGDHPNLAKQSNGIFLAQVIGSGVGTWLYENQWLLCSCGERKLFLLLGWLG